MMVSTPGSVQTEATPQAPPPPVMRLMDDVQMGECQVKHGLLAWTACACRLRMPAQAVCMLCMGADEPSTSARAGGSTTPPFHSQLGFGAHAAPTPPLSGLGGHYEAPQTQYEDVWVTIYGFSQTDIPLILKEFAKCGDILQWGTFGQPQANFIHVQVSRLPLTCGLLHVPPVPFTYTNLHQWEMFASFASYISVFAVFWLCGLAGRCVLPCTPSL